MKFYIDPSHPATNFTSGVRTYTSKEMSSYHEVEMEADSIDNILEQKNIAKVDLVSITTNGAEVEILKGMKKTISNGLKYICLARTGDKYIELMNSCGYVLFAHDDRGYTFRRDE